MSEHPSHVPLSELSIDAANVRKTGRGAEPEFAASIRAKGVIEPLIVRPNGKGYTIVNGGKRFAALEFLAKKSEAANGVTVTGNYSVPILVREETDAEARETSLMTNIIRSDMHPVDQFEAFAQMIQDGVTVDDIAKRYVMKVPEVRQALALAAIAPEIRTAWREGKIGGEAAEAYAQTKDLQHQVRVFNKLKGRAGEKWQVDREIAGDDRHRTDTLLKFVGTKEYEAAGHHINHSLFDDEERHSITVDDLPALKAMAAAKIDAECERLKKEGWGWAIPKSEAPNDMYAWRRLPHGTPSKDQKAVAGCTVAISYQGALEVERGYIKPGDKVRVEKTASQKAKSAKETTKAKEKKEARGGITNALATRLASQITVAASEAMRRETTLALDVAIAAMACGDAPAKITISERVLEDGNLDKRWDNEFDKYLAIARGKSMPEKLKLLATWVGASISFTAFNAEALPFAKGNEGDAALLDAIDGTELNAALRQHFDAKDFFASISRPMIVASLKEMDPQRTFAGDTKRDELAKVAVTLAKEKKWLPAPMRTAHYDGPAGKPAKSASKKSARRRAA